MLVGLSVGLEPTTLGITTRCANQLRHGHQKTGNWLPQLDLNQRQPPYQDGALPTELCGFKKRLAPRPGIEPGRPKLTVWCSTD